ncbi:hypothetical protein [Frankia sp. QA3]|uniref:hypothetical protein n=1 Tax=Frankia sp. QA3 TaxID=710111 RepID=UPI000269C6E7|nr:hypothetical protein [Frankia sp. QA3]EIV93603.1 hypothetical protein FraQA3DRAFT_3314 [Frankia sp. QA3]
MIMIVMAGLPLGTWRSGEAWSIESHVCSLTDRTCVQVLHGDYSLVSVRYEHERLTAVIDFRPPDPFLIADELGRVAFYPHTGTGENDWMEVARILIAFYLEGDLARSPVDSRPGFFRDDLDQFWLARHRAAAILFEHLARNGRHLAGPGRRAGITLTARPRIRGGNLWSLNNVQAVDLSVTSVRRVVW